MKEDEPLPPSPSSPSEGSGFPWMAMGIAVVLLAAAVGVVFLLSRRAPVPTPAATGASPLHPYAAQLRLTDPKMSTAQNFVGATVTYLEGTVTNGGDKTVNGATVESIFRNSLGEMVQRESQPLLYIHARKPYTDTSDLRSNPLKPGETREFRLTFDHVSADWNHGFPELRLTAVSFQ
ncbi:MAG: DUF2393 domain-containing protein [Acidobacteriota bacterium]|nr:DUF2393 domain-containing protein [Acidobacteriota bacterium]